MAVAISSVFSKVMQGDISAHSLDVPSNLAGPPHRVRLVAKLPWWGVEQPTLPHGALDPSSVTVDLPAFVGAVGAGSMWASMLLFLPEDRIDEMSDSGRALRSAAADLISKSYLHALLLPVATRDLGLSQSRRSADSALSGLTGTTLFQGRPLTPLEEAKAYSRAMAAAHMTRSLVKYGQFHPIPDPARHAELAFAAASGTAAAMVEATAMVRRTLQAIRTSALPAVPDLMSLQSAALSLTTTREDASGRFAGAVDRSS